MALSFNAAKRGNNLMNHLLTRKLRFNNNSS